MNATPEPMHDGAVGDNADLATTRLSAGNIAWIYAVGAALWVLGSDWLLNRYFGDSALTAQLGTLKGWLFVAVTATLLYIILQYHSGRRDISGDLHAVAATARAGLQIEPVWPAVLAVGAIVAITAAAIYLRYTEIESREGARIEAIAETRAGEVAAWMKHRMGETEFLRTSRPLAGYYLKWRERGDLASRDVLMKRLAEYRKANEYKSAAVLDEHGNIIAREQSNPRDTPAELMATALRAFATGTAQRTNIYYSPGDVTTTRLDFVIPLVLTGQPARGAFVLRIDPAEYLFPLLKRWPAGTLSGQSTLVHRDGDYVNILSEYGVRPGAAATPRINFEQVRAISESARSDPPGAAVETNDFRGKLVFGVARLVAGTDWLVVAKVDHSEIVAATIRDALWIALAGLIAIVAAGALGGFYRTRLELRDAVVRHHEQAERLHALQLLDAIATNSGDAIYAKDCDGYYLLFNREACRITGKSPEAVIGNDDYTLFPPAQAAVLKRDNAQVMAEGKPITFEVMLTTVDGDRLFLATKGPLRDSDGNITGIYGISRDITAMKQAENALRQSEARYRSMVQALSEGIVMFDAQGHALAANPAAERLFGLTETEIIERWREPDKSPAPLDENGAPLRYEERAVVRAIATGEPQRNVLHGRTMHDGSIRWNIINAEPVRETANGPVTAVIASFTDITQRRAAEQQLRKLSQAVEQSFSSIVITDANGRIEYVNAAFCRATGYDYHELIGKNPNMLQSGKTSRTTFALMWAVLTRGEPWTGEFINRRKNGEEYIENIEISPIRQADGRITHFVGIWEDVTQRKRTAEELDRHRHHLEELVAERTQALEQSYAALHASENFIKTIADNVPGAISYWDPDMRCRFANKTYQQWWGKTPADMLGRTLQEILEPEMLKTYEAQFAAALRGEPQQMERRHILPDGETSYAWSNYIPDFRDGAVAGFYVLAADITSIKQAEIRLQALNGELSQAHDALQRHNSALANEVEQRTHAEAETRRLNEVLDARKQALERAMKNLESFSYSVSHDLRAPLRAISGYAGMLVEEASEKLSDEGRHMLDRIIGGARKMDRLILAILNYSRTERLQRKDSRVDMARLAAKVAQDLTSGYPQATFTADNLPQISADATMVEQILTNLIGNAFKFSSRRSDARIEVGATTVNGIPEFFVRDNGAGFNQQYAGKLFNLFQRMHSEQEFPGTGVGLATVKRLIEIHGGRISAESVPGEHTIFRFTLAPDAVAAPRT